MNATDLKRKHGYSAIGKQYKKILASDAAASDQFGYSIAASNTRIVVCAPYEDTTGSDAGSAYIFDIDGKQFRKIQASDAAANDYFGSAVAISDTRIVVGAYGEDTTGSDAGSAYIFDIYGNQLAKIQASDAAAGDNFGGSFFGSSAVAASNTRIVVGSWSEDATASDAGSAYIFDINGTQLAKIQASDAAASDRFGFSVAASNTRIVVGAPWEDTTGTDAGSAYIFDINGTQLAKIQSSDIQLNDRFGTTVAVSDTRIVVGAPNEDTSASNAGSAYIFDINGTQLAKIQASDPAANNQFGYSVSVSDNRIVVGAPTDGTGTGTGAAYIFDINGNFITKALQNDAQATDKFGYKVAVSNKCIVVSAVWEDAGGATAGSAYIFSPGFSPFGDLCAYYDLGDPTVLDTNFLWSDYK